MNHTEYDFYKKCRKENRKVSVYLMNGIRIYGWLGSSDDCSVIVRGNEDMLIYKHSIMSIVPDIDEVKSEKN